MRVLGLDPSLSNFGLCSPARCWSASTTARGAARLSFFRREVFHAATDDIDIAVIEGYAWSSSEKGARSLAELGGVIRLALYDAKVPWFEVNPVGLKIWATGDAKAGKDAMLARARWLARQSLIDVPDHDAADAYLLWTVGMHLIGRPVFRPNALQRRALERVHVPDGVRRKINLARSA